MTPNRIISTIQSSHLRTRWRRLSTDQRREVLRAETDDLKVIEAVMKKAKGKQGKLFV